VRLQAVRESWGQDASVWWAGEESERVLVTIPISQALAAELFEHRARSPFQGDDERVFVSPHRGSPLNPKRYAATLREALVQAGITEYVRPFQDGRHSAITNAARAGRGEMALMTIAGHSDSRITRRYTHLAGVMFQDEGERMGGSALWGRLAVETSVETRLICRLLRRRNMPFSRDEADRGGTTRTCNPRFWRPILLLRSVPLRSAPCAVQAV
jgi:hypothetical protein